jgi:hypothetical protein
MAALRRQSGVWLGLAGLHRLYPRGRVEATYPLGLALASLDHVCLGLGRARARRRRRPLVRPALPKPTAQGRPPVSMRLLSALEVSKQELACSDEQICSRLRTDLAVMYA